jgi:hypothetical protein
VTTKAQRYPNSCGAASLLCAAHELGVANIPINNAYSLWINQTPLNADDFCETLLYQVTSNRPNDLAGSAAAWGYSMPSGIVTCARALGLQAEVHAYRTKTVWLLKKAYGAEMQTLRQMNALHEHNSTTSLYAPGFGARELKILAHHPVLCMLHYVMVRHSGTVMDPANGVDVLDVATAKTGARMHGTGLSIFVHR